MSYIENYNQWKEYKNLDSNLKKELESLSEAELEDAFYMDLEFGTGGLRGILGVGTNRMNIYTCLLYTSPSPRDRSLSRMPSSA